MWPGIMHCFRTLYLNTQISDSSNCPIIKLHFAVSSLRSHRYHLTLFYDLTFSLYQIKPAYGWKIIKDV